MLQKTNVRFKKKCLNSYTVDSFIHTNEIFGDFAVSLAGASGRVFRYLMKRGLPELVSALAMLSLCFLSTT